MNNKKLIIFMPSIEGGGVEKNLFIIANFLSSKIKDLSLITASREFDHKFKNLKIIKPSFNYWANSKRKYKYLICLLELLRLIINKKNITVFAFQANLYCILLCKIFNKKIIIRSNSSPSGWSNNFIKKKIFTSILGLADRIIVNSLDFKKEFKLKFNINATCIYNPLNQSEIIKLSKKKVDFPFYKKNKDYLKIITVGRFTDQKDHLTLLKAINLIHNKLRFKLLIIGRGVNEKKILNYIAKKKLENSVKILGFQKNPFKYLKLADLFILSSKFEGLPNVLLEAASLKKFIISTNCPTGPKEILCNGKGGFLFKIEDYKSLSKKIINYSINKKKLEQKINFTYKNLFRFDKKSNLKKYLDEIKYTFN